MNPTNRKIIERLAPDYLHTAELHGDSYMSLDQLDRIMQAARAQPVPAGELKAGDEVLVRMVVNTPSGSDGVWPGLGWPDGHAPSNCLFVDPKVLE